jgi:putative resolvase
MKLSQYAKKTGISYITALRHWKAGMLRGKQLETGTIIIFDDENSPEVNVSGRAVLYARVSSSESKNNLDAQLERLRNYASAKGYTVAYEIKEVGSGLNDHRRQLENVLAKQDWSVIVVEHKDRLARFGINYMQILLGQLHKKIEVINEVFDEKEDIMQDFVSIITSFTARIYGNRRSKRKTEKIIAELNSQE